MLLLAVQERKVAVDSLRSVAQLLTEAYQPLHDTVHGRSDVPENHSLDTFFSAVKATADVSLQPPIYLDNACLPVNDVLPFTCLRILVLLFQPVSEVQLWWRSGIWTGQHAYPDTTLAAARYIRDPFDVARHRILAT